MGELGPFIWVLIPLAGILVGAFKEWLQFKQTQNQLGTSAEHLSKKVVVLEKALEESESARSQLIERIQNLETIVTSPEWDALDDTLLKTEIKEPNGNENKSPLLADDIPQHQDDTHSMTKAARLARRLGT